MAAASADYHEPFELLDPETVDRHRAIVSLQEEIEATDWYDQRIAAAGDPELRAILAHNRDEEKEHAAMLLEWLRRRDEAWDEHLRGYLFTDRPIVDAEQEDGGDDEPAGHSAGSLGIGSLRSGATR